MQREPHDLAATEPRLEAETEELLSLMAHELHEPLRKIATFGELVRERAGPALDAESLEYLERIRRATERMRATLSCVLAFARVPRGLPFAEIDLGEVVAGAVEKQHAAIAAENATIETSDLPLIEGDPFQMQELFEQLIGNALKFRRTDVAPLVRIHAGVAAHDGEGFHVIHVSDNGMGFDDAYAERIFRPFERLHGRGLYPGAGMGLSICRKIALRHRARLEARGTPGQGAVFTLVVPVPASAIDSANEASPKWSAP